MRDSLKLGPCSRRGSRSPVRDKKKHLDTVIPTARRRVERDCRQQVQSWSQEGAQETKLGASERRNQLRRIKISRNLEAESIYGREARSIARNRLINPTMPPPETTGVMTRDHRERALTMTHPGLQIVQPKGTEPRKVLKQLKTSSRNVELCMNRSEKSNDSDCLQLRKRGRGSLEGKRSWEPEVEDQSQPKEVTASCATTASSLPSASDDPKVTQQGSVSHVTPTSPLPSLFRQPVREIRNRRIDLDKTLQVFILENRSTCNTHSPLDPLNNADFSIDPSGEIGRGDACVDGDGCKGSQAGGKSGKNGLVAERPAGAIGPTSEAPKRRRGAARSAPVSENERGAVESSLTREISKVWGAEASSTAPAAPGITVPVPRFRLHSLGIKSRRAPTVAMDLANGAGRKRPAATVPGRSTARFIAPPLAPRGGAGSAGFMDDRGYLQRTKNGLVRTSHVVRGNDYDMNDEDLEFLSELNKSIEGGGRSNGNGAWAISCELFEAMVERMERQDIRAREDKKRQESSERIEEQHDAAAGRAMSLLEEADEVIASARSNTDVALKPTTPKLARGRSTCSSKEKGNPMTFAPSVPPQPIPPKKQRGSSARKVPRRCTGGAGGGNSGGGADSDSDQWDSAEEQDEPDPHVVPVSISESDSLPLLRARVRAFEAFHQAGSGSISGFETNRRDEDEVLESTGVPGCTRSGSRSRARGVGVSQSRTLRTSTRADWEPPRDEAEGHKFKGSERVSEVHQRAARNGYGGNTGKGAGVRGEGDPDELRSTVHGVTDETLRDIYRYWARKRQAYGGPMLRCFHKFMMRKWKRMEDHDMEAEDEEDASKLRASVASYVMARKDRQTLEYGRLCADLVHRREGLKRHALVTARSYWQMVNETGDDMDEFSLNLRPRAAPPPRRSPPTIPAPEAQRCITTRSKAAGTRAARSCGVEERSVEAEGAGGPAEKKRGARAAAAAARVNIAAMALVEARPAQYQYRLDAHKKGEGEKVEPAPVSDGEDDGMASTEGLDWGKRKTHQRHLRKSEPCASAAAVQTSDADQEAMAWPERAWQRFERLWVGSPELTARGNGGVALDGGDGQGRSGRDTEHGLFTYRGPPVDWETVLKEASEVPRNLPGIGSEEEEEEEQEEHPASHASHGASRKVAVDEEKMPGPSRTTTKEDDAQAESSLAGSHTDVCGLEPIDGAGRGMARVTRSRCAKRTGAGSEEDGQSGKKGSSVRPLGHSGEAAGDYSKANLVGSRIRKRIALESPMELLSGTRNVRGRR